MADERKDGAVSRAELYSLAGFILLMNAFLGSSIGSSISMLSDDAGLVRQVGSLIQVMGVWLIVMLMFVMSIVYNLKAISERNRIKREEQAAGEKGPADGT